MAANATWHFGELACRSVIGLISAPIFTRPLGTSPVGQLALFKAVTSPLPLLERGLGTAVFGFVSATSMTYGARRHTSLGRFDASLNLPEARRSNRLRRPAVVEVVRGSFDSTVEAIERNAGTRLAKQHAKELVGLAAQDFDAFYDWPEAAEGAAGETELLVLNRDGKGIPRRREELREAPRKGAEGCQHEFDRRLSRDEESHRKRVATVAAVNDLTPQARRPEDALAVLRPVPNASGPRPRVRNERVWASVEKSAQVAPVTGYLGIPAECRPLSGRCIRKALTR